MDKKESNVKNIISTVWSIIFVVIFIAVLYVNNYDISACLAKGLENKAYYKEFLWPGVYGKINLIMAVITFICGYIHIGKMMDLNTKSGDEEDLLVSNVAISTQAVASVAYVLTSICWLKSLNFLTIVLAIEIVFAVVSIIKNNKNIGHLDDDRKQDIWKVAGSKINLILIAVVLCVGFGISPITKGASAAKDDFYEVSAEKIEFCFGHVHGVEENRAMVKLEFVNNYGKEKYALGQLEQEYENFKKGEGSWETLWRFCEDSVNIELNYENSALSNSTYPYYEMYGYLNKYYSEKYNVDADEKLGDYKYFATCVEKKLNEQGLTVRQLNDSSTTYGQAPYYTTIEYKTATAEQVKAVCQNVATGMELGDITETRVETLDFTVSCNLGDYREDLMVSQDNGYTIESVGWYVKEDRYDNGDYASMDDNEFIKVGVRYKAVIKVSFPAMTVATQDVNINVEGVEPSRVEVEGSSRNLVSQDNGDELYNTLFVSVYIDTMPDELQPETLEVGYEAFRPDESIAACEPTDESDICSGECIGLSVYNVETGETAPYEDNIISGDNQCYIAAIKVTPDNGASFANVENIVMDNFYFRAYLIVPEYDDALHKYTPGEYPTAYFEKHLDGEEEYIIIYLPYYQVASTGVNGDVQTTYHLNGYDYGNYIYLVEGSVIRLHDKPELGYEIGRYEMTNYIGEDVNLEFVDDDISARQGYTMPAYPITITGYFE